MRQNKRINIGLIGVGGFGWEHFKLITRMEHSSEIQLVAVCDPSIHKLPEVASNLKSSSIRIYDDYHVMLSKEAELTAVFIAAPIPFHNRMVKACLAREVFVYLEKPPVPLLSQLDALIDADTGRKVSVGFQMIESVWSRRIKTWINEGTLGEIQEIRVGACWPRSDSYYNRVNWAGRMNLDGEPIFDGPATNAMAHLIHNIMFFAGNGLGVFAEPIEVEGELYRARPIESYDTASIKGKFASGIRFLAALTHATEKPLPFQLEVIGSKGWARVSEDGQLLQNHLGSFPCHEEFEDLMLNFYKVFFSYVRGESLRPSTLLRDARGYSIATNVALQSSGGIHTIDEKWIHRSGQTGESICSVEGLQEIIADSLHNPLLFLERGVPWAVKNPEKS